MSTIKKCKVTINTKVLPKEQPND